MNSELPNSPSRRADDQDTRFSQHLATKPARVFAVASMAVALTLGTLAGTAFGAGPGTIRGHYLVSPIRAFL